MDGKMLQVIALLRPIMNRNAITLLSTNSISDDGKALSATVHQPQSNGDDPRILIWLHLEPKTKGGWRDSQYCSR
jgi:hypothetical protein